jgi:hypothetical protein
LRGVSTIKSNTELQIEMADGKLAVNAMPNKPQATLF